MYTYRIRDIKLRPGYSEAELRQAAAKRLGVLESRLCGLSLVRRSTDARKKEDICIVMTVDARLSSPVPRHEPVQPYHYQLPEKSALRTRPLVVGGGPAGLFAAYALANAGARPLLIERGLPVSERGAKVQSFFAGGALDTECNVQFGEGGAGAFSDGKLTTGIKNERIGKIIQTFIECGAPEEIGYEAKPHIGTDRLPQVVSNLRKRIEELGGEVKFSSQLTGLKIDGGRLKGARCIIDGSEELVETDAVILAVGHSARDTFEMLFNSGVAMQSKAFSVGVRIEHLQSEINKSMYGRYWNSPYLGAADYKLAAHLGNGRGVYTFCMCPGGQVVAAASEQGGVVTNAMSSFARDGVNANSALLVGVDIRDFGDGVLAGMNFQRELERRAFCAGGGDYSAPVFRADTLLSNAPGGSFGEVLPTYLPGVRFASPEDFLPRFVTDALREALVIFGRRIHGFDRADSVMTGTETRSSSPLRILRGSDMQSVNVEGLYPCGEGAGYAGGIMSAACDGIAAAEALLRSGC